MNTFIKSEELLDFVFVGVVVEDMNLSFIYYLKLTYILFLATIPKFNRQECTTSRTSTD